MAKKPSKLVMVSLSDEDMLEAVNTLYAEFERRGIDDPVAMPIIAYMVADFFRNRLGVPDDDLPEAMVSFGQMVIRFAIDLVEKRPRTKPTGQLHS